MIFMSELEIESVKKKTAKVMGNFIQKSRHKDRHTLDPILYL